MATIAEQALTLSPAERLHLIDEIWRSLSVHPESLPVTEDMLDEFDRRRERYREDPDSLQDWNELKDEISQDRG